MIALADKFVEFPNRQPILTDIAQVQRRISLFQKCFGLAAGGASRLLQKLDF
jgi:hypothetical protein